MHYTVIQELYELQPLVTKASTVLPPLTHPQRLVPADDRDESDDTVILQELENIDDELDAQGIHIVKIADDVAAKDYGIEDTPALVYFEHEVQNLLLLSKPDL